MKNKKTKQNHPTPQKKSKPKPDKNTVKMEIKAGTIIGIPEFKAR